MSLLGFGHVNAQNNCAFDIDGQVVDAETGEGLSYASVILQESSQGVYADFAGFFSLSGICEGSYTLKVSHIGCATEKLMLQVLGDTTIVFELSHDESILREFVVEGKEETDLTFTKIGVRQAQLETTTGLQLAEQALAIPGMRMQETGNTIAKPVFRGLQGNRLLVLNAGVRQEGQYWGSEHAPEIDPFLAQQVSVIEGVDALRYAPDAIGGLLLVEPADVFGSDSLSGSITGMGATNGRGGALGGELMGRVSERFPLYFRGQISAKKFGDIKTPDVFLDNTGAEELNYSYALGWKGEAWKAEIFYSNFNQRIGIYRYSHLGNLTDLYEVITGIRSNPDTTDFSYDIDRPNQEVGHELFKGSFELKLDDENTIEAIYSRQFNSRKEFDAHVRGTIKKMKLTLNERISKRTDLSIGSVSSILQSGTLEGFNFFPDKIMTGTVENGKVKTVINPPTGWSDPFKSRVKGTINQEEGQVVIDLRISLGWVIIAFYGIWYSLLFLMLYGLIFKDSDGGLEMFGILIAYSLFPLGLGKLKVNWDKRRLEKWIEKKIKTVPNKVYSQ